MFPLFPKGEGATFHESMSFKEVCGWSVLATLSKVMWRSKEGPRLILSEFLFFTWSGGAFPKRGCKSP